MSKNSLKYSQFDDINTSKGTILMQKLVLASTSRYRATVLSKLGLPFAVASPAIDELILPLESAAAACVRLAIAKARNIGLKHRRSLVIGSDQIASLGTQFLGKPETHDKAFEQLNLCSGQTVCFYTGLCLLNTENETQQSSFSRFDLKFRVLNGSQIENYLDREQPYDCAGSFKAEGLGISLLESLSGGDPNALIGLPLIDLIDMLLLENIDVLST